MWRLSSKVENKQSNDETNQKSPTQLHENPSPRVGIIEGKILNPAILIAVFIMQVLLLFKRKRKILVVVVVVMVEM